MIYVTGDTHGDHRRFCMKEIERISSEDSLIVCGDFGYIFRGNEKENEYMEFLAELPFQILFVDGNHENFDLIGSYPVDSWCGGKVHIIRKNNLGIPKVIHLMRGQVYEIQEKKIFTFGGGYSIDRYMRTAGYSWWSQEMPTDQEMQEAIRNLKKHHYSVDYIITHTAPEDTMSLFHPFHAEEKQLNNFLEWVRENTKYEHWYFGHLHRDEDLWRNQSVLWFDIRNAETNEQIEGGINNKENG